MEGSTSALGARRIVVSCVAVLLFVIAENANSDTIGFSGGPVVSESEVFTEEAGYYQVESEASTNEPAYWMPAGEASSAPAAVQDTLAYESIIEAGSNDTSGALIFDKDLAVLQQGGFSDCPQGWVCMWRHADYDGRMLQFRNPGFWQALPPYNFNDKASSLRNNKNEKAVWFAEHLNGNGARTCMFANTYTATLGPSWNDTISSIKIREENSCP